MASKLTERQQQILDLIRQAVASTGFPPPVQKSPKPWASARPTPRKTT